MKKTIAVCIAVLLVLVSFHSFSQQGYHKIPAWVSEKGYWVVERNIHTPRQCIIRFYNNDNVLVGTKEITGTKLKLNRKKTKIQLKSMLEAGLLQWARRQEAAAEDLVKKP